MGWEVVSDSFAELRLENVGIGRALAAGEF